MNTFISEKNYHPIHLGNDWGFYVDLENSYSTITSYKIIRKKYNIIFDCDYYYSDNNDYEINNNDYEINNNDYEINNNDYEVNNNYYEINNNYYEINDNYEINIYKSLIHALIHISSITLITTAFTFYVFWII